MANLFFIPEFCVKIVILHYQSVGRSITEGYGCNNEPPPWNKKGINPPQKPNY